MVMDVMGIGWASDILCNILLTKLRLVLTGEGTAHAVEADRASAYLQIKMAE